LENTNQSQLISSRIIEEKVILPDFAGDFSRRILLSHVICLVDEELSIIYYYMIIKSAVY